MSVTSTVFVIHSGFFILNLSRKNIVIYASFHSVFRLQILAILTGLRYAGPEHRIFNRVISDISVVLRKLLTISDSIETGSPVKTEIAKVISLSTTELTEITRFKKKKPIFTVRIP